MLLIGYENHRIELHVRCNGHFECRHSLIGHEDWIRDLDVCQLSPTRLLIASCSQDYYIRLWRVDSVKLDSNQTVLSVEDTKTNTLLDEDDEEIKSPNDEELKLKR